MELEEKITEKCLQVRMFGEFSIRLGDQILTDDVGRIKKVWMLIEYLLVNRKNPVTQDKLIEILWSDEKSDNPVGALKNLVYRARSALKALDPSSGAELIQYATNAYAWNDMFPVRVDAEEFEELGRQAAETDDEDKKVKKYCQAIDLYRGVFLPKSAYAEWVVFKSPYYATLYNDYVLWAAEILHRQCRYEEMVTLCEQAIQYDQYNERIHRYLMEGYVGTGQNSRALAHYSYITNLFYKEFGIGLSEETRHQHKRLIENFHNLELDVLVIRDGLKETHSRDKGAYFCSDHEVFRGIYRAHARLAGRAGVSACLGLITLTDPAGGIPNKEVLQPAKEQLTQCALSNLQRDDVVSKYSSSQLIVMFPMTDCETGKNMLEHLSQEFRKVNKRTDIELRTAVCQVEPAGAEQTGGRKKNRRSEK